MESNLNNNNIYLKSILMPFLVASGRPDDDQTSSIIKTVNLTANIPAPFSGAGLFLLRSAVRSSLDPIKYFIWDTVSGQYLWSMDLPYDEDLAENFTLARTVSGGLKVQSATQTGGVFNVSGTLTAVHFQDLPDITKLRYETINSYKRNNHDSIQGETIANGIVSLYQPDGRAEFRPFATNAAYSIDSIVTTQDRMSNGAFPAGTGWRPGLIAEGSNLYDSTFNSTGIVPPNAWGKIKVTCMVSLTPSAAVGASIVFGIIGRKIDPDGVITALLETQAAHFGTTATETTTISIFYYTEFPTYIDSVSLYYSSTSISGSTLAVYDGDLTIDYLEYYQDGWFGPGALIGFESLAPGQMITLGGVCNYEVVPNADLARQIGTNFVDSGGPFEIMLAERFISNAHKYGIRMLMTKSEYDANVVSRRYEEYLDNKFLATASGFGDFWRKLSSLAGPIMREAAPMIGGAIGGPTGAMLGRMAAGIIPEAAVYRQTPQAAVYRQRLMGGPPMGSASGYDTPPTKLSRLIMDDSYLTEELTPFKLLPSMGALSTSELTKISTPLSLEEALKKVIPKGGEFGHAALLGQTTWNAAIAQHVTGYSASIVELPTTNMSGGISGSNYVPMRDNILMGLTNRTTGICKAMFPIAMKNANSCYMGSVMAAPAPIAMSDNSQFVMLSWPTEAAPLLIGTNVHLSPDVIEAVALAYVTTKIDGSWPSDVPCFVFIDSPIDFAGGSLGAAAYAAIAGLPIVYPLTGAVSPGVLYTANDLELKLKCVKAAGFVLGVTCEMSDLVDPSEQSLAITQAAGHTHDIYNTPHPFIFISNFSQLRLLAVSRTSVSSNIQYQVAESEEGVGGLHREVVQPSYEEIDTSKFEDPRQIYPGSNAPQIAAMMKARAMILDPSKTHAERTRQVKSYNNLLISLREYEEARARKMKAVELAEAAKGVKKVRGQKAQVTRRADPRFLPKVAHAPPSFSSSSQQPLGQAPQQYPPLGQIGEWPPLPAPRQQSTSYVPSAEQLEALFQAYT